MVVTTKEIVVEVFSPRTFGVKEKDGEWFNLDGEAPELDRQISKEVIPKLRKGALVKLYLTDRNAYKLLEIVSLPERKEITAKDEMVGFEEVLNRAHEHFKQGFSVENELNALGNGWMAKSKVTVHPYDGGNYQLPSRVFVAHGEATPENTGDFARDAIPRMAETRAMSRALRLALGEWVPDNQPEMKGGEGDAD